MTRRQSFMALPPPPLTLVNYSILLWGSLHLGCREVLQMFYLCMFWHASVLVGLINFDLSFSWRTLYIKKIIILPDVYLVSIAYNHFRNFHGVPWPALFFFFFFLGNIAWNLFVDDSLVFSLIAKLEGMSLAGGRQKQHGCPVLASSLVSALTGCQSLSHRGNHELTSSRETGRGSESRVHSFWKHKTPAWFPGSWK